MSINPQARSASERGARAPSRLRFTLFGTGPHRLLHGMVAGEHSSRWRFGLVEAEIPSRLLQGRDRRGISSRWRFGLVEGAAA